MTRRRLSFALSLAGGLMLAGAANAPALASPVETGPAAVAGAIPGVMRLAQTQPPPASAGTPAAPATSSASTAADPIGNVATLTGTATVIRDKASVALKLQDDVFMNDVLQTAANSTLGVTFNDATTFNLTANASITIDNYLYEEGGKQNAALFDVARGTVAFVAAALAHSGDMRISTPTATLGIRGTTGLVEVPEGASASSAVNVAIKLYPDPDGRVGRIEVNDRAGARLGFLTQGASGFSIRAGAGGRLAALPLAISPQQALRDRGIVRQVHAAQSVGRRIVTQRQIQRQQNPNRPNPGGNPPRPQRQNGSPQRPPASPQPGPPNRQGQQELQPQPGLRREPNAPNGARPGLQNRPSPQRPAALAPKRKPPKPRP